MVSDAFLVELYIANQWQDYEIRIDSLIVNERLHSKLRPVDSTASITFTPNQALFNQLKLLDKASIPARIKKNGELIYTGYLRKKYDIGKQVRLEPMKAELVSPSFLLKRKIGQDIEYKNKSVSFIVNDLLTRAGVSSFTVPTISSVIPGLFIEAGKQEYHSLISSLLFEYGYVGYFDKTGSFVTFNLNITNTTTTKIFDGTNTLNSIQQIKSEEEIEKVVVDWTATKTLANAVVFSDTSNAQNGYKCYIEIPPNSFYLKEEILADLDSPEGEVLSVDNLSIDIIKDSEIQVLKFEPRGNKVLLSIKNTSPSVSKFIRKLDVKAGTAVVKREGVNKSIVINNPNTEKIEEYQSKYIFQKTDGDLLAQLLSNYYQYSDFKYKLQSRTSYELGDIVLVSDPDIGSNTAIVVNKSINHFDDLITYELEAVDEYVPSAVEEVSHYKQPSPSGVVDSIQTVVEAGLNPDGTLVQPINSNTMIVDVNPNMDGLYLTKDRMGLYYGGVWRSYIQSDGKFGFIGDSSNYVQWNGTKLEVRGDVEFTGDVALNGVVNLGDEIKSSSYSPGLSGWSIKGNGDAELNNVVVRGTVVTNNTSSIQGTISTGALVSSNYNEGTSGFSINSTGSAEFNDVTVRGVVHASSGSFSGDVTTSNITATGGTIGGATNGWQIGSGLITAIGTGKIRTSSTTTRTELDSTGLKAYNAGIERAHIANDGSGFLGASNIISWTNAGAVTIGGFNVNDTTISNNNLSLVNTGNITAGTSNDVIRISADNTTDRLWIGNTTNTSAPFRVSKSGVLTATGANISGTINATSGSFSGTIDTSNITATGGTIGSWIIGANTLASSTIGNSRVELNKTLNRVSVIDNSNNTKVAIGYLQDLAINGSLTEKYTAMDYGIWVAPGDKLKVDGPIDMTNGAMTVYNSTYQVQSSLGLEMGLGNVGGDYGLHWDKSMPGFNVGSDLSSRLSIIKGGVTNSFDVGSISQPGFIFQEGGITDNTSTLAIRVGMAGSSSVNTVIKTNTTWLDLTGSTGIRTNNNLRFARGQGGLTKKVECEQSPNTFGGNSLEINAGDSGNRTTTGNGGGGTLRLQSGRTIGTFGSTIELNTPTPAAAAGTVLNNYATRMYVDHQGVKIWTNGVGTDTSTIYIKDSNGALKERVSNISGWDSAVTNNHTHSNKATLDGITATNVTNWNTAFTNNHTHTNKTTLDGISATNVTNWNTAFTNNHTHSNKNDIDGITATTISNWNTSFTNNHTHSNKATLDGINQGLATTSIVQFARIVVNGNIGRTDKNDLIALTSSANVTINGSLTVTGTNEATYAP